MKSYTKINSEVRDVIIGKSVIIMHPANIYECTLQDGVRVGPFVEIQRGVSVGINSKIQSHTFICEYVDIGNNCFIGHGVMFINDLFDNGKPAGGDKTKWKKTIIGDNVSIGSNATILPVEITAGAVIGAGSVVTKSITERGVYAGNPAVKLRDI